MLGDIGQHRNDAGMQLLGHERRRHGRIRTGRRCPRPGAGPTAIDPGGDSFSKEQDQAEAPAAWRARQYLAAKLLVRCDRGIGTVGFDHWRFFSLEQGPARRCVDGPCVQSAPESAGPAPADAVTNLRTAVAARSPSPPCRACASAVAPVSEAPRRPGRRARAEPAPDRKKDARSRRPSRSDSRVDGPRAPCAPSRT